MWNATALYGGQVQQVVLNPITPTTVYAVSRQVGLFRSRDGGANWSYVLAGGAEDLAVDPLEPRRLYLGGGMQRSDDGWVTMTTGLTDSQVSALVFCPTNPMTMYVGTLNGNLFVSANGGASWAFLSQPLDSIYPY